MKQIELHFGDGVELDEEVDRREGVDLGAVEVVKLLHGPPDAIFVL